MRRSSVCPRSRRRRSALEIAASSPWIAAAVAAAAAAVALMWSSLMRAPETFLEPPWVVPSAPLVVTHVRPSSTVSLLVDPSRGPTPLPADVEDRLSLLVDRRGLRLTTTPPAALRVTDPVELASSAAALTSAIVAPIPGRESRRALFVVSPIPRVPPSTYPTLIDAASPSAKFRTVAFCASELEATLFAVAWASAGGGDAGSAPGLTLRVHASAELAVDAAIAASERPSTLALVAVWSCAGSPAVRAVTSRIRGSGANAQVRGDASWRYVPYHPSDDPGADGRAFEEAPHQLHARAPSLRFEPIELVGGGGGGPGKDKKRLTLVCAPAVVVLDDDEAHAMAGLVAEALMYGGGYNTSSPVDPAAAAECAALEALGGRLLGRTEALVREASKRGLDAIVASPYGRPAVPILEQFGGETPPPPIELSPVREITAEADGVTFRTIWYDEAGSGRGVIEATFASSPATLDGVSLRRGDRVVLTSQERAIEQNGTFLVVDDRTMQSPVALSASAFATALTMRKDGVWTWRFSEVSDGGLGLRVDDEVAWLVLPGSPIGRVVDRKNDRVTIEVPASAVVASPASAKFDRDWLAPLAVCSADHKVPTRQLCAARHPEAVWDSPCKRDADCPFSSSASSYRGRCLVSGRCEVPIGAELVGWRASSRPSSGHRPICACRPSAGRLSIDAASEACCEKPGGLAVFELDRL